MVEVELAFETLLDDLHVEKAEEAHAEAKASATEVSGTT